MAEGSVKTYTDSINKRILDALREIDTQYDDNEVRYVGSIVGYVARNSLTVKEFLDGLTDIELMAFCFAVASDRERHDGLASYGAIVVTSTISDTVPNRPRTQVTPEFVELLENLNDQLSVSLRQVPKSVYLSDVMDLYVLRLIYGDTVISEIAEKWADARQQGTINDFVRIADRWAEFKDYPISWSFSVLGIHYENLGEDDE